MRRWTLTDRQFLLAAVLTASIVGHWVYSWPMVPAVAVLAVCTTLVFLTTIGVTRWRHHRRSSPTRTTPSGGAR